jgi:hypothetical protein
VLPLLLSGTAHAIAQNATPQSTPSQATGLPSRIKWTFNFDAGAGGFGFDNSLFTGPREGVIQDYGDNWAEGFIKPALSGSYPTGRGEIYGKVSVVGERTYASPPPVVGFEQSSFGPEDLHLGWRSGSGSRVGKNVFDFVIGRAPYRIGHGFLVWDGAGEGGSRGGYWSNARKAFEMAGIAKFRPGRHTIEAFYLERDELPENDAESRLWGGNYELQIGGRSTVGGTYLKVRADPAVRPLRDGLAVYNARAYLNPLEGVSFEFEFAAERHDEELLKAEAWTGQAAYEFSIPWKPKFTYRYADFEGDDPATATSEAFDPLFLGFHDWGTWWQGEIGGEYFLANSNLRSHLLRAHITPNDTVSGGVLLFKFLLDRLPPGITDNSVLNEIDAYVDWKINEHFTASFVAALADPKTALQQTSGRTETFRYGMVYLAYSY